MIIQFFDSYGNLLSPKPLMHNRFRGKVPIIVGFPYKRISERSDIRFNRRYQLADLVPRLAYVAARTPPLPHRLLTLAGTAG